MSAPRHKRQTDDWYPEPDWIVDALLDVERPFVGRVADPCAGAGNIPRQIIRRTGGRVLSGDIVDRGSPYPFAQECFRQFIPRCTPTSIVSNPPYSMAREFIDCALAHTTDRVCVLLRLAFLGSQRRRPWFETVPLARVWISSRRPSMPPGDSGVKPEGGRVDFAWFVFEHGHRGPWHGGFLPDNIRSTTREDAL